MRLNLITSGILILVVGLLLLDFTPMDSTLIDSVYFPTVILSFAFGGINIAMGATTRKSSGVRVDQESARVKLSVDKGVIGSTIYTMAFSENKLVLKRLSSGRVTLLTVLMLAIFGFAAASIIGAAEGGLTAFSIQEFVTQRRRNLVEQGNVLDPSSKGDLEFPYSELDKVELGRNRLRLYLKKGILRIVISRRYPAKMRPALMKIIGSKESDEVSGSSRKPTKKENH